MKTLLLLRHAKSSWKDPTLEDHDRPLNKRGKRDAPRMGRLLQSKKLIPDLVISSTACRARETAERVVETAGYRGEILYCEDLYHAGPDSFLETLAQVPNSVDRLLVVGHNPGIEEFLEWLTGEEEILPTAALAQISVEIDRWSDLTNGVRAHLLALWKPKELNGLP